MGTTTERSRGGMGGSAGERGEGAGAEVKRWSQGRMRPCSSSDGRFGGRRQRFGYATDDVLERLRGDVAVIEVPDGLGRRLGASGEPGEALRDVEGHGQRSPPGLDS